ncbi:MAG: hypothetical protein NTU78_02385 [Alphaproteobacteria bacterium]|nr:hypothetical protein [Alphaproteobacteria bacterium]
MMMRKPRDNSQALAAFMAKKAQIDAMLIRLMDLSADHFDVSPDSLHWGHVRNLEHVAIQERWIDVLDQAFLIADFTLAASSGVTSRP